MSVSTGKKAMLVVDSDRVVCTAIYDVFSDEYNIIWAKNEQKVVKIISEKKNLISIILLDISESALINLEILKKINEIDLIDNIPVVMIVSEDSVEYIMEGYNLGASDIIYKPINPNIVRQRVKNIVEMFSCRIKNDDFIIDSLTMAVEFRNGEPDHHINRIKYITEKLLSFMSEKSLGYNFDSETIRIISNASAVHDVGKITIPDNILLKPGKLSSEEFEIMKTHTVKGCEILKKFDNMQNKNYYKYCYDICRYHHERWDGKGYPDGLSGKKIPIWAQIVSVADVYDALVSKRVYKPAYTHKDAIKMMINNECGLFNPEIMECFLNLSENIPENNCKVNGV